jgi:hypothetical protein
MKTIVLCLSAIVILAAGCSKNNTTATTGRDAFVGNYHMYDTAAQGSNPAAPTYAAHYNMSVTALSGSSDKIVLHNVGGFGDTDTGIVSGTLATFPGSNLTEADLAGNTISLNTDYLYANGWTYRMSTGTKY